jgi:hypothetical protein
MSTPASSSLRAYRTRLAAVLIPVVPLGFGSKFYAGAGAHWVHSYAGGVVYEFFWVLLVLALFPRLSEWRAAAGVFAATSLLEVLQLWHPPALEAIRATFLGHALIGSTFGWWDFPHYLVGCAAALLCARLLRSDPRLANLQHSPRSRDEGS